MDKEARLYATWKRQGKDAPFKKQQQVIPAIFQSGEKEPTKPVALEITTLFHLNLSTRYSEINKEKRMNELEVCAKIYSANAPYLPLLLTEIVLASLRDYTYDGFIIIDFMRLLMSRNQLSDNRVSVTVAKVIEGIDSLEETMPEIVNLVSDFFAKAVSKEVIGLETIAKYTTNGRHSPLLLVVLQKLCRIIGDSKLLKRCRLSEIDLMASLHLRDQTIERLEEILIERRLAALIPYARANQSSTKDDHNLNPRHPSPIKASENAAKWLELQNDSNKDEGLNNDFTALQAPVSANLSESKVTIRALRNRKVYTKRVAPKQPSKAVSGDKENSGKKNEPRVSSYDASQSLSNTGLEILMDISQLRSKGPKIKVLPEFHAREVAEKRKLEAQLTSLVQTLEENGGLENNPELRTRIELMLNQIDLKDDLIKNLEIVDDC